MAEKSDVQCAQVLWECLGDIPIDDNDQITEPFLRFPAGTCRFDIWHWFESSFGVRVADLMF